MTTLDILREARGLVAEGWTQGTSARSAEGWPISPKCPDAAAFCVLGALYRPATTQTEFARARKVLQRVALVGEDDLPAWNDDPRRTQAEVLALYSKAIERLEATP